MLPLPDSNQRLEPGHAGGKESVPLRVLLVDDDPINRKVVSSVLEQLACRYSVAKNGREAVESYRENSFDIILMDCFMPEMDGYEATTEIRRLEGGTVQRAFIIALTASTLPEDREKCTAAGIDDYFPKPVQVKELRKLLEKLHAGV